MVGPEGGLPLWKAASQVIGMNTDLDKLCCGMKHPWFGAENVLDSFRFSSKKLPVSLLWEKWRAERRVPQRHCEGHCRNGTET